MKKRGKQAAGRVEAEREKQVTAQSVQLRVLEHDAVRFEQVLVQDGEKYLGLPARAMHLAGEVGSGSTAPS